MLLVYENYYLAHFLPIFEGGIIFVTMFNEWANFKGTHSLKIFLIKKTIHVLDNKCFFFYLLLETTSFLHTWFAIQILAIAILRLIAVHYPITFQRGK